MRSLTVCALLVHTLLLLASVVSASTHTVNKTTTITRTVALRTSTTTTNLPSSSVTSSSHPNPPSSSMPGGPYSSAVFRPSILNSTNFFRNRFLAEPLQWDTTLARFAHRHAKTCIFEHSGGPYGENLAEGFATPALGVDAWAAEEKHYEYPNGGFSESTGHFTQLVWQNTTHVGCAAVDCGKQQGQNAAFAWYLVCEYDPPGNVIGEFRYNVRKPGESKGGKLGFGVISGAPASRKMSALLAALVAAHTSALIWA